MEILKVDSLSKVYGKGENEVRAIDDISFTVEKGQFLAIVGPSGSGKSTLIHEIGGVDLPSAGSITIDNMNISSLNQSKLAIFRRRHVGLIYQFYNLLPVLTVEENITLPLKLDNREENPEYLNELLDILGLKNRRNYLPNQLSGGQQQRVSIGRALINNPALILADEPTGNLDRKNAREIIDLLKISNKKYSQTVIMITHDEKVALEADRIITLEDGRIISDRLVN